MATTSDATKFIVKVLFPLADLKKLSKKKAGLDKDAWLILVKNQKGRHVVSSDSQ